MKKFLFLLAIISLSLPSFGQDLGKNVDYQYHREGKQYDAYSLFANTNGVPQALNLVLVTSSELSELKTIFVKSGQTSVKIPFKKIAASIENDDKMLHQMAFTIDLVKFLKTKMDCEQQIVFVLANKTRIELPFNGCRLKEEL